MPRPVRLGILGFLALLPARGPRPGPRRPSRPCAETPAVQCGLQYLRSCAPGTKAGESALMSLVMIKLGRPGERPRPGELPEGGAGSIQRVQLHAPGVGRPRRVRVGMRRHGAIQYRPQAVQGADPGGRQPDRRPAELQRRLGLFLEAQPRRDLDLAVRDARPLGGGGAGERLGQPGRLGQGGQVADLDPGVWRELVLSPRRADPRHGRREPLDDRRRHRLPGRSARASSPRTSRPRSRSTRS